MAPVRLRVQARVPGSGDDAGPPSLARRDEGRGPLGRIGGRMPTDSFGRRRRAPGGFARAGPGTFGQRDVQPPYE